LSCTVPLFWYHGRFGRHGWGDMLATEWVPNCRTLTDLLRERPGDAPLNLAPLFTNVTRMHTAGFRHGTLLPRNILINGSPAHPSFIFLDIPRFHRFPRDIRGTRMARYDLLYLCDAIRPYTPAEAINPWLEAYGMTPREKSAFLSALQGFQNTSRMRRVIGAEFNLRSLLRV